MVRTSDATTRLANMREQKKAMTPGKRIELGKESVMGSIS
jgi:hypothetical protein